MSPSRPQGELAIVLHTHMPYVEGFGTWPFGEEWLWEAMIGSYLPLLELLDAGAPLTLSLTPVLCDQLEAPGIAERFTRFVEEVRSYTHHEDARGLRAGGHDVLARELERSWREHEHALERFRGREEDLLAAFAPHVQWTSSATHAVLPLLATDAGVRAQVQTGISSHRRRFDAWQGGFWLPECAHAPHLDPLLADAGVHATCVELTGRFGLGAPEHLHPLVTDSGVVLVPVDRLTMELVWGKDGYPSDGVYRDYHRHTIHHHQPWANDGGAYDHERAVALAREHARDFVARTIERLAGGGLVVCALDTELLGHWWYEGVHWLEAVVEECARQGLALVRLDEATAMHDPLQVDDSEWEASSWGKDGDLSTWSGPQVADMAFEQRAQELHMLKILELANAEQRRAPAAQEMLRQLLALQASDWPFMISCALAVPYARERFEGHRQALRLALAAEGATRPSTLPVATSPRRIERGRCEIECGEQERGKGHKDGVERLRNIAVRADPTVLLGP